MKPADIGGAIAILIAGYIVGRDTSEGTMDFQTPTTLLSTDMVFVIALLATGYYLAVYLS